MRPGIVPFKVTPVPANAFARLSVKLFTADFTALESAIADTER